MRYLNLLKLTVCALIMLPLGVFAQSNLPTNQVKSMDGRNVTLQDYIKPGAVTVISFWATWCAPCKKELDAIKDLYPEWEKLYGVNLIAISTDDSRSAAKIKPMVEQKGWKYTILNDSNQELQKALNFQAVPQTFLIDQSGKIVWTHSGYVAGDEFELEDQIKLLVNK